MNKHTLTMMALVIGAASATQAADNYDFCDAMKNQLRFFDAKRDHAENPWIQEFTLKMRAQYQAGLIDPAGGNDRLKGAADGRSNRYNNEWRRLRLGAQAKVLGNYTLYGNFNIGGVDGRRKYSDGDWCSSDNEGALDELYLQGKYEPVTFTLGKHKPAFMGEYRTSSAKIITIERSLLVNQLKAEKTWGLSFKNTDSKAKLGWTAGVWANGADEDNIWYMPSFDGDNGFLVGLGLNYATGKNSRLYLDYMHSTRDEDADTSYAYEGSGARDVLALTWEAKQDRLSFMAEAIAAFDVYEDGAENAFGLVLMPSYRFSERWEGVFRYQIASGSNAIAHDSRYSTTNSTYKSGSDLVQGFYLGANYYVCPSDPHAMKLMFGAEYLNSRGTNADGDKGFTGWNLTTAVRVNF